MSSEKRILSLHDETQLIRYFKLGGETGGVSTFGLELDRMKASRLPDIPSTLTPEQVRTEQELRRRKPWYWRPNGEDQTIEQKHRGGSREPSYTYDEDKLLIRGDVSTHLMRANRLYKHASAILCAYYGDVGQSLVSKKGGRLAALFALTETGGDWLDRKASRSQSVELSYSECVYSAAALAGSQNFQLVRELQCEAEALYKAACNAYVATGGKR